MFDLSSIYERLFLVAGKGDTNRRQSNLHDNLQDFSRQAPITVLRNVQWFRELDLTASIGPSAHTAFKLGFVFL